MTALRCFVPVDNKHGNLIPAKGYEGYIEYHSSVTVSNVKIKSYREVSLEFF